MPKLSEDDGGKIKPSGYHHSYTKEQVVEIAKCKKDPIYFILNYVMIEHPTKGAMKFKLHPFQKNLIKTYHHNTRTIAMLSRQCGKALALDTPIPTPTGWTTMGEIQVGDKILGDDGKPVNVSFATDVMENHDCYEVEFDNGEVIVADAEHIWRIATQSHNDGTVSDVTTRELLEIKAKAAERGHGVRIQTSSALELDEASLPIKPYTLGVWLGDGNSNDGRFTSHVDDIDEVRQGILNEGYEVCDPIPDSRRPSTIRQTIYGIYGHLREMGILGQKRIPGQYLRASETQRLELLRGLMDTDGHARPRGACEFYQKDPGLAWDVFELVASLGMKPRMRGKTINGQVYHTVVFSTTKYNVFKLTRKSKIQERCLGHQKNLNFYIKEIRETKSVPVRCIQVDNESHMFLCGRSMIPTHNTTTAAAYLLWWAIFKKNQKILIASKDQDGANEIMDRLWYAYEELPWWIKPGVTKNDVTTKKFDNRSVVRAVATTKTSGRGKSNSLIYLDEFAFVRPGVANDFWTSIYPTISTGGSIIITSTPNTDEDKFAQIWFNCKMSKLSDDWVDPMATRSNEVATEEDDYETLFENDEIEQKYKLDNHIVDDDDETMEDFIGFHAHWTKVPDKDGNPRGEKFKRDTLAAGFTLEEWLREFECGFVSGDSTLISAQKLARLRDLVRPPRFVDKYGTRWYEEIVPNAGYAVVLDPSEGVDLDDACIQVWQLPNLVQVAEWNSNQADQVEQTKMLRRIMARIYLTQQDDPEHDGAVDIYYSVERNGLGIGILRTIEEQGEEKFPGWLVDSSEVSINVRGEGMGVTKQNRFRGLLTSVSTKKRYCTEFKSLVERNLFVPRSKALASQMKTFIKTGNSYRAKEGAKDDIIMSCVIMCMLIDELRFQEPDLEEYLSFRISDDGYSEDDENHPDNMAMVPII